MTHHKALHTAMTNPQLATGPQKCVVLGPTGELMKAVSAAEAILGEKGSS